MPIYEYQCKHCGHQLEVFQKITEEPLVNCPECHQDALGKLISSTSFQLKGTGWYATDFRDKGKPKTEAKGEEGSGSKETSPPSSEAKSTENKKDTKSSDKKSGDSTSSSK